MIIDRGILAVLKQHKFLRGSLYKRMEEKNPMDLLPRISGVKSARETLAKYTEAQIAPSPYWSYHYALLTHTRFPLAEEKLKDSGHWWIDYLYDLLRHADNMDDAYFAQEELRKMGLRGNVEDLSV